LKGSYLWAFTMENDPIPPGDHAFPTSGRAAVRSDRSQPDMWLAGPRTWSTSTRLVCFFSSTRFILILSSRTLLPLTTQLFSTRWTADRMPSPPPDPVPPPWPAGMPLRLLVCSYQLVLLRLPEPFLSPAAERRAGAPLSPATSSATSPSSAPTMKLCLPCAQPPPPHPSSRPSAAAAWRRGRGQTRGAATSGRHCCFLRGVEVLPPAGATAACGGRRCGLRAGTFATSRRRTCYYRWPS
jgi:hypothetical protein